MVFAGAGAVVRAFFLGGGRPTKAGADERRRRAETIDRLTRDLFDIRIQGVLVVLGGGRGFTHGFALAASLGKYISRLLFDLDEGSRFGTRSLGLGDCRNRLHEVVSRRNYDTGRRIDAPSRLPTGVSHTTPPAFYLPPSTSAGSPSDDARVRRWERPGMRPRSPSPLRLDR